MPIVMMMRWAGVTPEQYERVRALARWEQDVPVGANFHVAAFDGAGLRVTDLWDTPEDFQAFVDGRLTAAVAETGITTEPVVEILPVHALFTPAWQPA